MPIPASTYPLWTERLIASPKQRISLRFGAPRLREQAPRMPAVHQVTKGDVRWAVGGRTGQRVGVHTGAVYARQHPDRPLIPLFP
jgi:hypothetical protein